jgi:hypothetical protein
VVDGLECPEVVEIVLVLPGVAVTRDVEHRPHAHVIDVPARSVELGPLLRIVRRDELAHGQRGADRGGLIVADRAQGPDVEPTRDEVLRTGPGVGGIGGVLAEVLQRGFVRSIAHTCR